MGPVILYRAGSWNGVQWTGSPQLKPNPLYSYNFVSNEKEVFYTYDARILTRLALSPSDIEGGQVLYVRVAASEAEIDGIESERQPSRKKQLANTIIIVTSIISGIGVLAIVWIIYMWRKKLRNEGKPDDSHGMNDNREGSRKDDNGLTIYAWNTISDATDNFSDKNKLGEGGFGPVYKGILIEGQEIAVKRLSKTFGGDQTEAETNRVVGTYGYMSPEYIVDGIFSMKSDVYSFGVLVLEIVSGKRNRGFYHTDHKHNLLGHAWRLWNEEKALELIDKSLDYSSDSSEILRCIHHWNATELDTVPSSTPDLFSCC
ncbi:hypothetical protein Q3G72_005674 [Acer saccharum]|nr:hypothetical protein Q3G72_005674 [Acer saccharum]